MNRGLRWILVGALVASLALSGCTKKEEPKPAESTAPAATTEAPATPEATAAPSQEKSLEDLFKKAATFTSFSYEMETTSPMGTFTSQIWSEGENFKTVMKMPQGESVTIVTKGKTVTYDPASKMGMSYTLDDAGMEDISEEQNPLEYEAPDDLAKLKILGEENVNGYDCYVIDTTDAGTSQGKIWLSKEYGVMIRMQMTDTASGSVIEMNCKNLKFDAVPKGTFDVPKDIKLIDAGNYQVDSQ